MEATQIGKQMIGFQKAVFDNTFMLLTTIQEQGEHLISQTVEKNPWLPEDGKKACSYWTEALQENNMQFKEFVDNSFNIIEKLVSPQQTSSTTETAVNKKTVANGKARTKKAAAAKKVSTAKKTTAAGKTGVAKKTAAVKATPAKGAATAETKKATPAKGAATVETIKAVPAKTSATAETKATQPQTAQDKSKPPIKA